MLNSLLGSLSSGVAASTSSYESIASATGTGSSKTITFNSIPSTYTSLQIRINGFTSSADNWNIRINGDSGTNYTTHYVFGNGSSVAAGGYAAPFDDKGSLNALSSAAVGGSGSYANVGIVDIHNYTNTSQNKTVRSFFGGDANGSGGICLDSVLWLSTSAITSLSIITTNYNMTANTTISLYGIKGA